MDGGEGGGRTARVTWWLLDRWMRLVARLVPKGARREWRAEWDGELWYGVAGKPRRVRWLAAAGLARAMLRDALDVRRGGMGRGLDQGRRGGGGMGAQWADLGYCVRRLRKAPGFTAVVVVTLALGVGASVTVFSVVDALLLSPLPYPDADRLVMLWMGRRGADVDKDWFSGGHFTDIRSQTTAFEELTFTEGGTSTLTHRGRPASEVGWVRAPSTYLRLLGAGVARGRLLDEQDDRGDATPVALLTDALWRRAFGADPDIVGQDISLDGRDVEIVGVLSPHVLLDGEVMPTAGGNGRVDVVLSFPITADVLSDRLAEWYNIIGKLAPGVTLAWAQVELDRVAAGIQERYESDPDSGFFIRAVPLLDEVVGSVRRALWVLLASVGGVLLIACVNVANLLLARGESRRRELGVRAAMGAGRRRLVRQLLTESAVLATMAGVVGVGLAVAGLQVVWRVGVASLPRMSEIGIDGRILLFSLGVTATTCFLFGLVPAWRAARVDPCEALRSGGRGSSGRGALWSRFNLASVLVVAEIGLSLVLLVGGGLLVRSFAALEEVDPGFRSEGRLTFRLDLSGDAYADPLGRVAFEKELAERLASLPGVTAVGAASHLPFDGSVSWAPIDIEDYVPPQGEDHQIISEYRTVTPGYFDAMGIPLIAGRAFVEGDGPDAPNVAIVDEHFARSYFPDRDPVGMRVVSWGPTTWTIVGVVGTVKHESLDRESRVTTYLPHGQFPSRRISMVLETALDPIALAAPATRTVAELDDDVAVVDVLPMASRVASSLAERRFATGLLEILGLVALTLAAIGVYGLISYRVHQGTRDLSLRMALGATAGTVQRLVVRHGMALASAGVAAGLLAAVLLTRFMGSMLFGVGAVDGPTYAVVASGLVLIALVACWIPARRATRLDLLEAITGE